MSASSMAAKTSLVRFFLFPMPMPARVIIYVFSAFISLPLSLAISAKTSEKPRPWLSFSFPITKAFAPASIVASIFSSKPPALPLSFVTIYLMSYCFSIAVFKSFEKGPCMHIICLPARPHDSHISILSLLGRTRTKSLSLKASDFAKSPSSLLPVVRSIFPLVFSSSFTQASMLSKYIAPSATQPPRSLNSLK